MESGYEESELQSYWPSVFLAGIITAVIYSVLGILSGYLTIKGSGAGQAVGILACLVGAVGGVLVNWHYSKDTGAKYTIGKGALMGFLVALVAVTFGTIIGLIWTSLIDTGFNAALYDAQIAAFEAQGMGEDQIEMAMSFTPEPGSMNAILFQVGLGLIGLGILNAISGIIGAKIFAKDEE